MTIKKIVTCRIEIFIRQFILYFIFVIYIYSSISKKFLCHTFKHITIFECSTHFSLRQ